MNLVTGSVFDGFDTSQSGHILQQTEPGMQERVLIQIKKQSEHATADVGNPFAVIFSLKINR